MDKIEVSQRAREAAADHHWPLCNAFGPTPLGCSCGIEDTFARFERDILATRTGVAPVATDVAALVEALDMAAFRLQLLVDRMPPDEDGKSTKAHAQSFADQARQALAHFTAMGGK